MVKVRHWRERFEPDMDFVFCKRLDNYKPGDSVPDSMPINKRRWLWKSRYICEGKYYHGAAEPAPQSDIQIERKDKGWIKVTLPDGQTKSLRGEAALEQFLKERKAA